MSADPHEVARAARELLAACSEPIRYPGSPGSDTLVLVPENLIHCLRSALDPWPAPVLDPASDWYRGENGELIEVRPQHIPDMPPDEIDEIDEIICGPMHLETLDEGVAYIRVAGLMVNIRAVNRGDLSITCEPDDCTRIDVPPTEKDGAQKSEASV